MKLPARLIVMAVLALLVGLGVDLLPWQTPKQSRSERRIDQNTVPTTKDSPKATAVAGSEARKANNDVPLPGATANFLIPESVATAVGKGNVHDFRARLNAVGQLGIDLGPEALTAAYAYLRDPADEANLKPGQSFALKNDLLNVLREQRQAPAGLTRLLLDIRRDEAQTFVMRDYALQHLAPWFARAGADEQRQILDELQAAAAEIHQSYAGTALLALHRVRQEQAGAAGPSLSQPILTLLRDPSANLLARITAVQLSGSLGLSESAPLVANLAFGESVAPSLRTAAIRAIGEVGMPGAEARLRETCNSPDPRFRLAAAAALQHSDRTIRRN